VCVPIRYEVYRFVMLSLNGAGNNHVTAINSAMYAANAIAFAPVFGLACETLL